MDKVEIQREEALKAKQASIYLLGNIGEIIHYWPELEQALEQTRELWQDVFTKDSILARALAGKIQIWVVSRNEKIDLVFMTQAYQTDVAKVLQVFWAFGEGLQEVLELVGLVLDKFAAEIKATKIEAVGRPAFVRLLRRLGADFQYVTCGRDVRPVTRN